MNKLEKQMNKIMKDNDFENLVLIGTSENRLETMSVGAGGMNVIALVSSLSEHWQEIVHKKELIEEDELFERINALSGYIERLKAANILKGSDDK